VVEAKEAKAAYNEAKRVAKRVVWLAKSEDETVKRCAVCGCSTVIDSS